MPIGNDTFKTIYSQLNPEQRKAVDTIDGPVMVMAGPGTGKTQVLAARIANILIKTDTKPHNILALTFTDSAAKNMRERVVKMIGKTGYYVNITTFHAFCKDVIETHPEYFPLDREAEALTQIERFDIFEHILNELALTTLKPINAPFFYIRELIKSISDLKKEGVTTTVFEEIVEQEKEDFETEQEALKKTEKARREKLLQKHVELVLIYKRYQELLLEQKRYDFDDMITFVMEAFAQHEELLLEYQETLHYFLVDEYQDTNTAQNTVVSLLASYWGDGANIFVVGDPNQSIYRFQGASVENMLGFIDTYPAAQVVTLETGYRSPQKNYDAAHVLIQNNSLTNVSESQQQLSVATGKKLQATSTLDSSIDLFIAPSDVAEAISVVESIEQLLQSQVPAEEIAVIYRNNADSILIQELLDKKNIRYEVAGGANILDTDEIKQLLRLLEIIVSMRVGEDVSSLFEILTYEWMNIPKIAVLELARFSGTRRISLTDTLEKGYTFYTENCETCLITHEIWLQIEEKLATIKEWGITETHISTSKWLAVLLEESGYLDWIKTQAGSIELLLQVNTFFNQLKGQQLLDNQLKLAAFLRNIKLMIEHGIAIQTEEVTVAEAKVKLTTAHSAKGQEWQYVFIIKCLDGKWGNSKKRELLPLPEGILQHTDISKKEKNEDDRRLFYVALTRAKTHTQISYPKTVVENGSTKEMLGSMFIEEIKELTTDISEQRAKHIQQSTEMYLDQMLRSTKPKVDNTFETEFYKTIVKNFALSITALNDYLRDPEHFVYKHLLCVPEPRSEIQAYGTAMHRALEFLYRQWFIVQNKVDTEQVLLEFEKALLSEAIHIDDFERRLILGKQHLQNYCKELEQEKPSIVALEKMFGKGLSKTYLDDIQLIGRVDRIDWLNDEHTQAKVIDYKTGRPKSDNEIEGLTQTSQKDFSLREKELPDSIKGPYKRQLLFYKLLASLDRTFKPIITQGEFDFVEPDKQTGAFVKRTFELHDTEVEDLKVLIKQVMTEIRELQFLLPATDSKI